MTNLWYAIVSAKNGDKVLLRKEFADHVCDTVVKHFLKDHLDDCLEMIKRDDVIIDYITAAIAKVIIDRSFPMTDKNKEDG